MFHLRLSGSKCNLHLDKPPSQAHAHPTYRFQFCLRILFHFNFTCALTRGPVRKCARYNKKALFTQGFCPNFIDIF